MQILTRKYTLLRRSGQLGSLEHFYIYVNNLFGPIPPELGGFPLPSLDETLISGGTGNMAALRYFSIDDNFLEGSIPSTLGAYFY